MDEIKKTNIKIRDLIGGMMAEKYDGIQGQWDGESMRTKTGNAIDSPDFWKKRLPKKHLIGELWAGRGCFDEALSIVTSADSGKRWRKIRFMVFSGARNNANLGPHAEAVVQKEIESEHQFNSFYKQIINAGGEGIVINEFQFKRKPFSDDDGELIGFKKGTGRNAGRIGSFILRLRDGKQFGLGGLNDRLREVPPKIGAVIRFSYQGLTSKGFPRFASFETIRAETSLNF
jgi:DNA ligase-1